MDSPLSCFLADDCWFLVQSCWKLDRIQTIGHEGIEWPKLQTVTYICNKLWLPVRSVCYLATGCVVVNVFMAGWSSPWSSPSEPRNFHKEKLAAELTTLIWGITFGDTFNQYLDRVKLPDGLQMLNLGTRVRARRSLWGSESDSKSIHIDDSCWINNHHWIFFGRVRILQSFPLCSKTTFGNDPTHCSWCRYIGIFTLNDMFINKGYDIGI